MGVRIGIWISKQFAGTNGRASISQSNIPSGRYDLKVFGGALDGARTVNLEMVAETSVNADSSGKYSLNIDTSGIPSRAYKIEGAGDTKTIQVGGFEEATKAVSPPPSAPGCQPRNRIKQHRLTFGQGDGCKFRSKPTENTSGAQNTISPQPPAVQENGFIGWLKDSLQGIVGSK